MYLSIEKAPRKTPFDLCFALSISRFYPVTVFSLLNAPGGLRIGMDVDIFTFLLSPFKKFFLNG